jgi:16S rRNA processing protein RimM
MKQGSTSPTELNHQNTGSPEKSEPVFLLIGKLRRPFGVKGELVLTIRSTEGGHFKPRKTLLIGESHDPMRIVTIRRHDPDLLVTFEGVQTREDAARLANQEVFISASELPELAEGEYYLYQVIGLKVVDEAGNEIGKIHQVLETGANDVYIIQSSDGTEILIPDIPDVVQNVDIIGGIMRIRPQTWL